MATDVLALYDTRAEAQKAANALLNAGYHAADISVEAYASDTADTSAEEPQESGWEKMMVKLHLAAPKEHTDYYSQGLQNGNTLVTVTTTNETADAAVDILNQYEAVDMDSRSSEFYTGQGGSTATSVPTVPAAAPITSAPIDTANASAQTVAAGDQVIIPIVEEELTIGKRQVQRGGVRVYQRVTERPVEESVTLREEKVTIDRRPVDRAVTDADMAFQGGSFEVMETNEVAVVAKEARVVEEVSVGKTASEHVETVHDTVRRTNVEVEQVDGDDVRSTSR